MTILWTKQISTRILLTLEFKLEDLWVGLFWKHQKSTYSKISYFTEIWICLIPCFPFHFKYIRVDQKRV